MDRAVKRVSEGLRQLVNMLKWTDATEKQMEKECSHCGSHNHDGSSRKCPAMGRQSDKCCKMNHFANKCRSQDQADGKWRPHQRYRWNQDGHGRKNTRVNALAAESDGNEGVGYVFHVNLLTEFREHCLSRLEVWFGLVYWGLNASATARVIYQGGEMIYFF